MSAPGACILGCAGPVLLPEESAFFGDSQPWGFILFARNCLEPDQIRRLVASLRDSVGRNAPVFIDQEGGRVQRMRPPHWRQWMPPLDQIRQAGSRGPRSMYLRSRLIAEELRTLGIDVSCSPVADVACPKTHPFLKNRCYGTDAETVTSVAREVSRGLMDGGVLPVLKHIPGHGGASVDSHSELPVVSSSGERLSFRDFAPFRALRDLPMGMTGHIVYPAFDARHPATRSETMIGIIRDGIGFGGLLMTDDISMGALEGDLARRCLSSRGAGCDVVLHCNGQFGEMQVVVDASGVLEGPGLARAEAALADRPQPKEIDLRALESELDGILNGCADG
ncbi:MAG: glycoside hydrolase family 3 protein [Rhodobacter sp.]|nr:glycoside hydrolase family 3 protein [Rhodobacter sp.]